MPTFRWDPPTPRLWVGFEPGLAWSWTWFVALLVLITSVQDTEIKSAAYMAKQPSLPVFVTKLVLVANGGASKDTIRYPITRGACVCVVRMHGSGSGTRQMGSLFVVSDVG